MANLEQTYLHTNMFTLGVISYLLQIDVCQEMFLTGIRIAQTGRQTTDAAEGINIKWL